MTRRSLHHRLRRVPAIVLAVAAIVLTACSGSSGGSGPATRSSAGSSAVSSAVSSAASGPTGPSSASPSTPSGSIPIRLVTGNTGRRVPLVHVSVGDGPAVDVVLDTGSIGLVLRDQDLGSAAHTTSTPFSRQYTGFSLRGTIATAQVRLLGGATRYTSASLDVAAISSPLTSFLDSVHADGILGVAAGQNADRPTLVSPLAELPVPARDGYLIDVAARRLTLGPPASTGAIELGLSKANWQYPNGLPGYAKPVGMQWTIGGRQATLPTVIDTGGGDGFFTTKAVPSGAVSGGGLRAGTRVRLVAGGRQLESYVAGASGAPQPHVSSGQDVMNAGEGLFEHARIGLDLRAGRLVVVPT